MKKRENPLDIPGDILYYNQARVQKEWAQYAMKREIAWKHGNFRRVCPVIGRLRTTICGRFTGVYRRVSDVRPAHVGLFLWGGMIHTA